MSVFPSARPGQGVLALDPGIAGDALLRHAGRAPIHGLLVGALFHALLVAVAPVLVDQHDSVFGALVDRLPRADRQAAGIRTVVADPLEIEEKCLVLRQTAARHLSRFVP